MTITNRTARNKSGYVWAAAIFSSLLLTCCNSPSNKEPVAARAEPQSTAASKSAQQDLTPELADLAASGEFYNLTPDTARQRLSKFAKLEDKTTPEMKKEIPGTTLLLGANPASGIQWITMQFYQNDEDKKIGRWNFVSVEIALSRKEGDSKQIYNEFKPVLEAQMAKRGIVKTEPLDGGGLRWRLGGGEPDKLVDLEKKELSNPYPSPESKTPLLVVLTVSYEDKED
jgi:hypothetical protein